MINILDLNQRQTTEDKTDICYSPYCQADIVRQTMRTETYNYDYSKWKIK